MLSDYQLRNFQKYLDNCPPKYRGVPREVLGAYDGGRPQHGFCRGIPMRTFAKGGAFDSAGGRNDPLDNAALVFLAKKLSAEDWAALQRFLAGSDDDASDAEVTSLNERDADGPPAMDGKRRTALALDADQRRAASASFKEMFGDNAPVQNLGGTGVRALF